MRDIAPSTALIVSNSSYQICWAVSLLTWNLIAPCLTGTFRWSGFRSSPFLVGSVKTTPVLMYRSTSIDFAENQLHPSSVSLSPLAQSHFSLLQQTRIRARMLFKHVIPCFGLDHFGFGFGNNNFFASSHWTWLVVNTNLPAHYAVGTALNRGTLNELIWASVSALSNFKCSFFSDFPSQYFALRVDLLYLDNEGGPPLSDYEVEKNL